MPTTTTRLALSKPLGTETVDIDVLNANADKLDAAAGATICTSTTRPASPYSGQIIYETDTKLTWKYSGGWKLDTGIRPVVASASARNAIFPSPVVGDSVWRSDLGYSETYYAAVGSPARPAGWYSGLDGGLVPIVPTSVTVGSGTATVSTTGEISLSGVNDVNLQGCFSNKYRAYRIVGQFDASVVGEYFFARMMNGTTPGAGTYRIRGTNQTGASAVVNWSSDGSAFYIGRAAGDAAISYDISNPFTSRRTTIMGNTFGYIANESAWALSGNHDSLVSYSGIQVYMNSGTMSGNIQVYGYRN